ncbi:UDP-N-acetylmuramoyl-L-alanine--D-glutamate ligase [Phocaeicola barnesiae]|jgi:UDP-N-acetylmuramoylalanine--D-glutamate ligase|uniref:UDP-N-acetylmuramoylalanine--D-glutamate ligase n=1 Tax=Phocaeicola barnesiae TaxID=376804 RepID=A0AAW5N232_9BACT|nr:UDP-N-acetylmuramoyl-L-alanine--D-glutamate ligase [Phocaeicola barnesiae]MBS6469615.1 UDP-N-acetylmuramoyl-L-alanine--D-glutamate ligase [Bacteroides sp.]CDD33617.1 uDP-N-acetylmuramoylalanine--D-glutamate ligase [Bacteroides sp. CAG:714]MCF2576083.1 UDP-N-acetylmuramoyl-L-alanine--D-glutamate ligase [Phocaeicola barnesiae]MCF2597165.1 UDP-N-acetylmuramoyl-L-alanine--D-glutamate ligase [Phocaeicola barnesiae]MCR8873302.1 UDP-N-acetylmuramoyl-L-alanine--D-glutamate ligase [Phocaeicola barne
MAKRIVILGAGESGAGAAVLAQKQGFDTFVSDMSQIKDKYKNMLNERGIQWEEGKHTEELILNADEIIKSPGIPNDAPMILKLKAQGTPIISEIEFAGRYTNAKMICITGSNGKTTTTSLIYHIFKKAGLNVGLAGNIGQSLAYQVAECNYDYYVIELSSFQLDNMYKFHANIAVLMNITPDHLDRYNYELQNYVDAKFRIIQNQTNEDAFIFWNDDPVIQRELHKYGIHGQYYPFAEKKEEGAAAFVEQNKVYFTRPIAFNMEQEELALTGTHNLFNSMAAGISANIAGIRNECIREALSDFKGVEHRLEKVARVRGVEYINDSKATNVNSCWYALQSMKTKTVLILGGKDKGNDYNEIAKLVKEKCSGLIFLGLHNEKLHAFFDSFGLPIVDVQSMQDAVNAAYQMAQKGETVLLSPCCASFDLFKSYEDRGDQFKACVNKL